MAQINITDGKAKTTLPAGTYNGTTTSTGYLDETITGLVISAGQNNVDLTIGAEGSVTITLTDSETNAPIVGAKFKRSNADGSETYGDESIETDQNGQVTMEYLPWAAADAPEVHFMQTLTDEYHTLPAETIHTSLTAKTGGTISATNVHNGTRLVSLTDKNYSGMPIATAVVDITAQ